MNIEQEIMKKASEELMRSIDFEILCETLRPFGWTVLKMDYDPESGQGWNAVKNWVDDNFTGNHQEHNGTWLIELTKDATMFLLKWKCNGKNN
jgi:hypothetical protein